MTSKIGTLAGFTLAVAVGATYCGALDCFDVDAATTCVSSATLVDVVTFCEGGSLSSSCSSWPTVNFYADSTWYNHPNKTGTGLPYTATMYHPCGGPVHFTNPLNGQSSATEHCDYWQYYITTGNQWTYHYNGIDYTAGGGCGT